MTPEDAEMFYEDDEDPQKIFVRFDAIQRFNAADQIAVAWAYINDRYRSLVHREGWYNRGGSLRG